MTRSFSPAGVPGRDVAAYYRTRAEGGVGLIITEGIYPPHDSTQYNPKVPHLYGATALAGWRRVVNEVHGAGGKIFAQIWHLGIQGSGSPLPEGVSPVGPDMPVSEIKNVVRAYGEAAANAKAVGFDGVEIHAAHGYLIDQFLWEKTNSRTDEYGGDIRRRTRFAVEVVEEVRQNVGPDYPVAFRYSQWKIDDYDAKLANTPAELEQLLTPLVDAGVDLFHASARRFWEPAFAGSDRTFAGWTRKITGKPVIAVGSVTLGEDIMTSFTTDKDAAVTSIDRVLDGLEQGEFDMIAVGRSLIANPWWPDIVRRGAMDELRPFNRSVLAKLE
jgi:2,4-dienoyl-CoA reductase-like NADH-dependent reductase (Old Yellow Enzyme family)